jgi:ribonuclease HII
MTKFDHTLIPPSPDLSFELPIWALASSTAGLDEAGRGAWAGPVVAAAVMLPMDEHVLKRLKGVRDSKQVTHDERTRLAEIIRGEAIWGVGFAANGEIDAIGILPATRLAMSRALVALTRQPNVLLLDALFLPDVAIPQIELIKGDQRCLSIAAGSILAKTARDAWMATAADDYPEYGFDRHKGYGTREHLEALARYGVCEIHRTTFRPIKFMTQTKTQE